MSFVSIGNDGINDLQDTCQWPKAFSLSPMAMYNHKFGVISNNLLFEWVKTKEYCHKRNGSKGINSQPDHEIP